MTQLYTKEYMDERCADCREKAKAEQYRRQLGGQTAAHSKRKKEIEDGLLVRQGMEEILKAKGVI